jgi:hypothetical protein
MLSSVCFNPTSRLKYRPKKWLGVLVVETRDDVVKPRWRDKYVRLMMQRTREQRESIGKLSSRKGLKVRSVKEDLKVKDIPCFVACRAQVL